MLYGAWFLTNIYFWSKIFIPVEFIILCHYSSIWKLIWRQSSLSYSTRIKWCALSYATPLDVKYAA